MPAGADQAQTRRGCDLAKDAILPILHQRIEAGCECGLFIQRRR